MALRLCLDSLEATNALGARIGRALRRGDAVLLSGSYGAGKTTLVRALLRDLAADPELDVPSPSYTLLQTYDAPIGPIHHFDLWRLDDPEAILELGWEEARTDTVLVEWPERLGSLRPAGALVVDLAHGDGDRRRATLSGWPDGRL
jgi:tRNA threonylcarbamoyladenosine biosynthesis protein TsaE